MYSVRSDLLFKKQRATDGGSTCQDVIIMACFTSVSEPSIYFFSSLTQLATFPKDRQLSAFSLRKIARLRRPISNLAYKL